jgi:hypothetical protein
MLDGDLSWDFMAPRFWLIFQNVLLEQIWSKVSEGKNHLQKTETVWAGDIYREAWTAHKKWQE